MTAARLIVVEDGERELWRGEARSLRHALERFLWADELAQLKDDLYGRRRIVDPAIRGNLGRRRRVLLDRQAATTIVGNTATLGDRTYIAKEA